jgi:3-oxoadipate CoA-transferase beta subunit
MTQTVAAVSGLSRRQIAWRAAQDIPAGAYVNLGIGLPTTVSEFIPTDREVIFHSENGILGMGGAPPKGEEDWDLINAGKMPTSLVTGGAFIHHNDAFMMIRGGHIDVALMGAFEVSVDGDLANWTTESPELAPGVGGAMDLAAGAREVRILVEHTTRDGKPRLLPACTLPLTAPRCVRRIYTNLAVIDVGPGAFLVRELVEGMTLADLQAVTGAPVIAADTLGILAAPAI